MSEWRTAEYNQRMVGFNLDDDDIAQQARAPSQRWFRIGPASQTLAQYWITLTSKLSDLNFPPLEDVNRGQRGWGVKLTTFV